MPLYALGLMGVTRRMNMYPDAGWQPYFIVAAIGALIILYGIACTFICFFVSILNRKELACGGDPWDARTLEWATQSPPAPYNFPQEIHVVGREAFWQMKKEKYAFSTEYTSIHMPKSTATGVVLSALAFIFGFAMVWYIWWLAIVMLVAMIGVGIAHTFNYNRDYYIPADEVRQSEAKGTLA